ncbi:MAG: transporter substrate-binding domain-containing protein [Spirochaeta sp.]|nr:transporter substrate-binding domain-containing protein [Spirochaeta sp.]
MKTFGARAFAGVVVLAVLTIAGCGSPAGGGDADANGSAAGSTAESSSRGSGSALDEILERGTIRVGTTGDFYMSFIDPETNERRGYDVDLVKKLAADMGVEVEWVATDWANLLSGIAAGKYDITTGASYNMGRAKTAGYTLPVINVGTVPLVRREDRARFESWESINQPEVVTAARLGTVFEDQARALVPDSELKLISQPATEYQEVLSGKADVAITSLFDAANLVGQYEQLAIADVTPAARNAIGLLAPRDDQELINYLNVWITMQDRNGYLDELRATWNLSQ